VAIFKRKEFSASNAAEAEFARALKRVAKIAGHIVELHVGHGRINNLTDMREALKEYSRTLEPWARRQAEKMLKKVSNSNARAFKKSSKEMGKLIQTNVAEGDVGRAAAALMQEHVELIKSIPLKASERAQKLALEAVYSGKRADEVANELKESGNVAESDAIRIARTEVARATAFLNQARATAVGATHYRWRNSGDKAVRESHRRYKGKKLDGMVFEFNNPPTLDDGETGNPGTFPNCRCYAEPIFDEEA
jgi:SPP1 gp7 family putative phage head morphogenesis protein